MTRDEELRLIAAYPARKIYRCKMGETSNDNGRRNTIFRKARKNGSRGLRSQQAKSVGARAHKVKIDLS